MRCRAARRLLVAFQDGELSAGDSTRVSEHLAECESCRTREAHLQTVTPEPIRLVRPSVDPDWSQMDAALHAAYEAPPTYTAPVWIPARRAMLGLYGLALGLLLIWGVSNALRVQSLEAELVAATSAPPVETLIQAAAMQPASYKPPTSDGKPR